jgi:hypothetical protein
MPGRPVLSALIALPAVEAGGHAAGRGGRYSIIDGSLTATLTGPDAGLFVVERIDTFDIDDANDAQPGGRPVPVLVPVTHVEGSGPVDVIAGQAVLVTVGFVGPSSGSQTSFHTTVSLAPVAVEEIAVTASLDPGHITLTLIDSVDMAGGGQADFQFRLTSSLADPRPVTVVLDQVDAPSFAAVAPTLTIPNGAGVRSLPLAVSISCAADTAAGSQVLRFFAQATDRMLQYDTVDVVINVAHPPVTVTCNLGPRVDIDPGGSVQADFHVVAPGPPVSFSVAAGPLPPGITFSDGHGNAGTTVTVDGGAVISLSLDAAVDVATGDLGLATVFWDVDGVINGTVTFDIAVSVAATVTLAWRGVDDDQGLSWAALTDGPGHQPQWTEGHVFGDRASFSGPALAAFRDELVMAWRGLFDPAGDSDRTLYISSCDNAGHWSPQHQLGDRGSNWQPALAVYNGLLYMAWRGVEDDHSLWWATCADINSNPPFTAQSHLDDRGSLWGPTLAAFNGLLYMAWRGVEGDGHIWWSTYNGTIWSTPQQLQDRLSHDGPTLAVLDDQLYMFWRGAVFDDVSDQQVYSSTHTPLDPLQWTPQQILTVNGEPVGSSWKPAITAYHDQLLLATVGRAWSVINPPPNQGGAGEPSGDQGDNANDGGSGDDKRPDSGGGQPDHPDPAPDDTQIYLTEFDHHGPHAHVPLLGARTATTPALVTN